jgi:hypothetical protein
MWHIGLGLRVSRRTPSFLFNRYAPYSEPRLTMDSPSWITFYQGTDSPRVNRGLIHHPIIPVTPLHCTLLLTRNRHHIPMTSTGDTIAIYWANYTPIAPRSSLVIGSTGCSRKIRPLLLRQIQSHQVNVLLLSLLGYIDPTIRGVSYDPL